MFYPIFMFTETIFRYVQHFVWLWVTIPKLQMKFKWLWSHYVQHTMNVIVWCIVISAVALRSFTRYSECTVFQQYVSFPVSASNVTCTCRHAKIGFLFRTKSTHTVVVWPRCLIQNTILLLKVHTSCKILPLITFRLKWNFDQGFPAW